MSNLNSAVSVVVAHHHPQGLIRDDLASLVAALARLAERVVFVSTNLSLELAGSFTDNVTVIIRDNHGYDFYSYKTGIEALGDLHRYSRLAILNSSFISVDVPKLVGRFFADDHDLIDVLGLTLSHERQRHLQSFLMSFGPRCLHADSFVRWWSQMVPVDDRERVIKAYELGLSGFLRKNGFSIRGAYRPTFSQALTALARGFRRSKYVLNPLALNPTHFYWDYLLDEFGIAKIELVQKNPYGLIDAASRERALRACGAAGAA